MHYCVANMPGAVARTSTLALTNATLPYVLVLAEGWARAMAEDADLRGGLNVHAGTVAHPAVAAALGLRHVPAAEVVRKAAAPG